MSLINCCLFKKALLVTTDGNSNLYVENFQWFLSVEEAQQHADEWIKTQAEHSSYDIYSTAFVLGCYLVPDDEALDNPG